MEPQAKGAVLRIEDVVKEFNIGPQRPVRALNDISVEFSAGEWTYVVGGNGCGKTTLLRVIAGDLHPDSGQVIYGTGITPNDIVFIEQGAGLNLVDTMTVYENLALSRQRARGRAPNLSWYRQSHLRTEFAAAVAPFGLGLEDRLDQQVGLMSGGQQQAVVAAHVLLTRPRLVLLDEFTSALDRKTAPVILRALRTFAVDTGATIVAVTHDFHWIETTGDRVVVMDTGRIKDDFRKSGQALSAQSVLERSYGSQE